jgi:hypothetical protein
VLLPALGLRDTVHVGASINALVFAAAALLARRAPATPRRAERARGVAVDPARDRASRARVVRLRGALVPAARPADRRQHRGVLDDARELPAGIALGSALASRFARTPRRGALGFALASSRPARSPGSRFLRRPPARRATPLGASR